MVSPPMPAAGTTGEGRSERRVKGRGSRSLHRDPDPRTHSVVGLGSCHFVAEIKVLIKGEHSAPKEESKRAKANARSNRYAMKI
jgi:hypothetical protein